METFDTNFLCTLESKVMGFALTYSLEQGRSQPLTPGWAR